MNISINTIITITISTIIIGFIGSILHFTYEWSGKKKIVALFSAINESVWEHNRLALIPTIIFVLIYPLFSPNHELENFLVASSMCLLSVTLLIPLVYYPIQAIIKRHIISLTIVEFFFNILLSQIVYQIFLKGVPFLMTKTGGCNNITRLCVDKYVYSNETVFISLIILIFLILSTFLFTFYPPKLFLFKDSRNGKYGFEASDNRRKRLKSKNSKKESKKKK